MSDRNISFTNNCPILERTGDGIPVGRCWFYCTDGKTCPRHGNVEEAFKTYRETGRLTPEKLVHPDKKPCHERISPI